MSKLSRTCQYFVWPALFSNTALTLLGMEFTRASQVATGVLFHSSMTTSQSWWMLETLRSSTPCLRMPHRWPLPSAPLPRQWSSWRCGWCRCHVGILPYSPVSEGRGSCSASVCHSTFWHSWFPQLTVATQLPLVQPQTMTHPPPYLTVGKTHLSLYSSFGCRHTHLTPSEPNKFALVSSDHSTWFH